MPLTKKGIEIRQKFHETYGPKKGEELFYASINAGKITGAEHAKRKTKRNKRTK